VTVPGLGKHLVLDYLLRSKQITPGAVIAMADSPWGNDKVTHSYALYICIICKGHTLICVICILYIVCNHFDLWFCQYSLTPYVPVNFYV
jgi:hypothetical protein